MVINHAGINILKLMDIVIQSLNRENWLYAEKVYESILEYYILPNINLIPKDHN